MKSIVLVLLGVFFAAFGLAVENVFAEMSGLIAAVIVFAEAWNDWRDWHGLKAVVSAAVIGTLTSVVGYLLGLGFLAGMETIELIQTIVIVVLGALGLHPLYKKALAAK